MVILYSHLVTVWMIFVTHKNKADVKTVDKWLTYSVVLGYEVINQGRCFSQKDPKDKHLSDKMKSCLNGYTGCGLHDFYKKGGRRPDKFKFQNHFGGQAWAFFKSVKLQKDLVQPIRY